MNIEIVWVGKTKDDYVKKAIEEYLKRLNYKIKITCIPDSRLTKTNNRDIVKKKEAEKIMPFLNKDIFCILLDESGESIDSIRFSELLYCKLVAKKIVFVIGGVYGVDQSIKVKADLVLSFSKLTFTHQIIRVLLLEQLFRAMTIKLNKSYHY